ncbi:LuxR C-terminal-related transcriptional regulator [Pontibacter sp. 13R65]|uniref:response regulator transcription factor n=1 Tax=Pontibacter sp. 13R65 TaxID=3127458 RepID=UPI00301C2D37
MPPISVLVVEANLLVRRGLVALLSEQEEVQLVGETNTLQEVQPLVEQYQPQVVTIDCTQPETFSAAVIQDLKSTYPHTHWLALSAQADKSHILEVLRSGVCSYILKECGEQEILTAVRATARGDKFMCSQVLELLFSDTKPGVAEPEMEPLSPRETEIVQLIAAGKSTMQIADQLHLSYHTINSHRKNILRKLQIKSPAELIIKALDLGIIKIKPGP